MAAAKGILVAAGVALGTLAAAGCALAALFEAQGFGTPRDAEPRTWYVAVLAVGAAAAVAVPLWLWRRLLPRTAPASPLALAVAGLAVLSILGLGLR